MVDAAAPAATVELKLTDNLRRAIEHAFDEARESIQDDGAMLPFTIMCTSDGFDVADHPGDSAQAVYESVKTLLAREMPEAYAFAYDGYVETDEGRSDAILCEAAMRGDAEAYLLALPYGRDEQGSFEFAPAFLSAGNARQLYPRGTKPIVSGLVALAAERQRAGKEFAAGDTTATTDPSASSVSNE